MTNNRDLTFFLDDMRNRTMGVTVVVHASTDGLRKHHSGVGNDVAERLAAYAGSLRATAMGPPCEAVPTVAQEAAPLDFLHSGTAPVGMAPGTHTMLTQPAAGALLLAVADDRCTGPVLAQELSMLGKRIAQWWETAPRTNGATSLAG